MTPWAPTAHPRVGGENGYSPNAGIRTSGSSPRGRGKRILSQRGDTDKRLIPAWAGKTEWVDAPAAAAQAHPRVGGENALVPRREID